MVLRKRIINHPEEEEVFSDASEERPEEKLEDRPETLPEALSEALLETKSEDSSEARPEARSEARLEEEENLSFLRKLKEFFNFSKESQEVLPDPEVPIPKSNISDEFISEIMSAIFYKILNFVMLTVILVKLMVILFPISRECEICKNGASRRIRISLMPPFLAN